ncbi:hypothetical protein [Roseibium algae]|uniref:Secreted protein with PEP-CTERM sorting signal n=1 Tax=Roseibium algae TaxID=3123038 RepID=A0ABU8TR95_9HYPH
MKTPTSALIGAAGTLALSSPAFAHVGQHSALQLSDVISHFAQSPFHLAPFAIALVIAASVLWRVTRKR